MIFSSWNQQIFGNYWILTGLDATFSISENTIIYNLANVVRTKQHLSKFVVVFHLSVFCTTMQALLDCQLSNIRALASFCFDRKITVLYRNFSDVYVIMEASEKITDKCSTYLLHSIAVIFWYILLFPD